MSLSIYEMNAKEAAFADDFSVPGSLNSITGTSTGTIRLLGQININWPKIRLILYTYESLSESERKKLMEAQNLFANSRISQLKKKDSSV